MSSRPARILFSEHRSFRMQVLLIASIPLLLAGVVAFLVYLALSEATAVDRQADEVSRTMRLGQQLLTSIVEAQTGLRGYIIVGDHRYLEPYQHAVAEFSQVAQRLRMHCQDRSACLEVLDRVEQDFARYRTEVAGPVIALGEQAAADAGAEASSASLVSRIRQRVDEDADKHTIDPMKSGIRELLDDKRDRLYRLRAEAEQRRRLALAAGAGGPLVVVTLTLLLLNGLLRRVGRDLRRLALGAEQIEQGRYDLRLEPGVNRQLGRVTDGFNRMAEQLARRDRQALLLDRLNRALPSCRTTEEAWSVAGRYLPRILEDLHGGIYAFRPSRDFVVPVFVWGAEVQGEWMNAPFEPQQCWALRSGYGHHVRPDGGDPVCEHLETGGAVESLCVPMTSGEEILGLLAVVAPPGKALAPGQRATIDLLAETLALSIANLRLREVLRNQSIRDPLTSLYNRRFLDETLDREIARSRRTGQPLSVIALDIDHFKRFNDTWGHDAGDAVLMELARMLADQAREMDYACRLGGEEFILVLPRTDNERAVGVAERLRAEASALHLQHAGRLLDRIHLSLGVATLTEDITTAQSLIKNADQALYRAKAGGRNQVVSAETG